MRKIVELRSLREEVWNESKSDEEYEEDISGSIAFEEMIVNTVIIENQENGDFDFDFDLREDIDKYDKDTQLVKIVGIPIGYTLKHLTIRCSCSFEQLLWILTKCKSLESLNLSFYYLDSKMCNDHKLCLIDDSMNGEEKSEDKNVQETKQPIEFEEYQDHCFFVPIMESMKSLSVLGAFEDNTKERFVLDVIKCCPNLQELEYGFPGLLDDKFLTCLSKMCSKLKAVKLKSYSGATPLECVVSDETVYQFLKSQPFLEHLCIHPCSNISGEIFKKIGEFQQLKELHLLRRTSTHPLVAEARGIYFGGGILHNLTVLDIGDFEFEDYSEEEKLKLKQSLEQVAPNLKKKWGFSLLFEHDDTCSSENSNGNLEW
ncbi:hypothetical protein C9374_001514 [Naegleria lovaniensis]|uniref:Uncharacterized protein n=1 Tax=Naegleria lovaniensis TaxID=51637 RepID=A0AA88GUB9_NAELO|nr:uncharacterized protein C9374_001514 [Naegleria lovaniensis]KAG2387182.1 hypothetical protein C9374_001514 [Naegleria lovaniensis]